MRARSWCVTAVAAIAVASSAWMGVAAAGVSNQEGSSTKTDKRTITVTATGLVQGKPDVLELVVGVRTRERSAKDALARNSLLAGKVIDSVKEAGVDAKDVQTADFSISPSYNDRGDINGYEVSNLVNSKIRDFDRAGEVIDAATDVAGDEVIVYGVQFSFDDNSLLVTRARSEAVKRARTQARQLAEAADVDLGDLLSITEEGSPEPPVVAVERLGDSGGEAAAAPIEPGSESLSVQVTLVYEIE